MAVTSNVESSKLTLKLVVGQTESGADKYANRSISNISANAQPDNLYQFADDVHTLLNGDVSKILRTDVSSIVDEG